MKFTVYALLLWIFYAGYFVSALIPDSLTDRSIIYWAQIDDFSLIKNTGAPKFLTLTKSLIGIIMFVCANILLQKLPVIALQFDHLINNSVIRNLLNTIVSGKMSFLVF